VVTVVSAPAAARWRPAVTLWRLGYGVLALAPLALSLINLDPGRGFWVNLSVAAGFVVLSLLGLQFLLARGGRGPPRRSARTSSCSGTDRSRC
jgi:hypothetical protein